MDREWLEGIRTLKTIAVQHSTGGKGRIDTGPEIERNLAAQVLNLAEARTKPRDGRPVIGDDLQGPTGRQQHTVLRTCCQRGAKIIAGLGPSDPGALPGLTQGLPARQGSGVDQALCLQEGKG